jgi:uncharacterized protein YecE (DUF72 family)
MIHIGTAGWSIPRAVAGEFRSRGTHLQRYARVMACAEINTSFYREHSRATYEKWASATPRRFRFSVKLPQLITHDARLRRARKPLTTFLDQVAGLGDRLGPLLVQLPASFSFEVRAVRAFFELMRELHAGPVVCEPRHASWFAPRPDELLGRYRIGRVAADPAKHEGAAVPGGWTSGTQRIPATLYYRLHGSPRMYWSAYSLASIGSWTEGFRQHDPGADVWCIFDNTASGAATENALQMRKLMQQRRKRR